MPRHQRFERGAITFSQELIEQLVVGESRKRPLVKEPIELVQGHPQCLERHETASPRTIVFHILIGLSGDCPANYLARASRWDESPPDLWLPPPRVSESPAG
jgi:hypothetical protein